MENRFTGHGLCINGIIFLSPREALPFLDGDAVLVDLRDDFEKNGREFNVKKVISIPYSNFESEVSKLPMDRPLILADCVGLKSKAGVRFLMERGYESTASLIGGMVDWEGDGMPTVIDREEELLGGCACRLRPRKAYRSRSGC